MGFKNWHEFAEYMRRTNFLVVGEQLDLAYAMYRLGKLHGFRAGKQHKLNKDMQEALEFANNLDGKL